MDDQAYRQVTAHYLKATIPEEGADTNIQGRLYGNAIQAADAAPRAHRQPLSFIPIALIPVRFWRAASF